MADESQELAKLLLALKERSGRSYGALGKRLHISTSTVHRYCNGTTVPNDYAPLERLARVCGATRDELVELHRRWILADAARRRATETTGTHEVEVVADHAEDSAEVEPAGAPHVAVVADVPATSEASAEPPSTAAPAVRPRRRRSAVVAAAVVSAVAVTAAVAAAATQFGSASDSGERTAPRAAGQSGAARDAATASDRATAGTFAPASTTSPSSSAHASRRPGTPTEAGKPSESGGTAGDTAPPFHVNVLTNNWDSPCDQWFLLQRPPDRVAPPPAGQATDGWAASQGAAPAGHLRLQVTVQGSSSRPVVLHALRVVTTSNRTAPKGNAYMMGSGCGGDLAPASFALDLDTPSPNAKPVPGHEGNITTRATNFPYKVSVDDPEVLNIDASTDSHDVGWYLQLSWSSGDQQGTARIDDHGKPFRTVGMRGDKAYWYNAVGVGQWLPYTASNAD
ncbi:helix-turn-helix transcriptional regulator [Streptomyces sp. BK340]|uniref:transcriptional regulator n=1 Tax=Streptomyces sp. BK340 TaxID=2572903 RepID=UPI00119FA137|nr:helix-turn-helix transcriptional regulator [Streptomyces sp. BK340]TVZ81431.1 helix-turn-helix protein [Streptomyces sp. BK340]